jgi:hypothetical protein
LETKFLILSEVQEASTKDRMLKGRLVVVRQRGLHGERRAIDTGCLDGANIGVASGGSSISNCVTKL